MSESSLVEACLNGLWSAMLLIVPLVLAGAVTGAAVSALASALGVQDNALARGARIIAVIGALVLSASFMGTRSQSLATQLWSDMAQVDGPIRAAQSPEP